MGNLPAAFNQSIYLMISVPYALLGVFGFLIYRGMKKNEEFRQGRENLESTGEPVT